MSNRIPEWTWREIHWPQPFGPAAALDLLDRIGADHTLGPIVLELQSRKGKLRYLLGCHPLQASSLVSLVRNLVPEARITTPKSIARPELQLAGHVGASHHSLALNIDRVTAITRALLAGMTAARRDDETLVLQVMLGARFAPSLTPTTLPDPHSNWIDIIRGTSRTASAEVRSSIRTKAALHGFKANIRIGAHAESAGAARGLILSVLSGLRVAEAAGVHLTFTSESPKALIAASRPWGWPLRLNAEELMPLTGWPIGDGNLPGVPGLHPKVLPPPENLRASRRPFAISTAPGEAVAVGLSATDSLQHTLLIGPTGSGKSNAMLALILDAIEAGRGVLVIDPKRDLSTDILARIPEHRKNDVVVIDPTDSRVVGLNPFVGAPKNPELVADSILAVFKELFADSWGPRTQDVLTAALITLARYPGATLTMLPALLTDAKFRRKLTRGLTDKIGLEPFWAAYEAMSAEQRAQVIAPVMNKLRQFLLRPALRAVLGQSEPLFNLNDLFTKRRIVLVSLNKGLIGSEGARLLGSLVVSQLWPLTLARAAIAPERRHVVNVFIDEVQDYLALPTDLADALSQARGLGVGFTIAHQYRKQLPIALRAGVDANARNRIVFGLNADDASEIAKQAPELVTQDFIRLPRFGTYLNLMVDGHSTGWFSAKTLPARAATTDPIETRAHSAATYGRDAHEVETEVLKTIGLDPETNHLDDPDESIGRRRASGKPQ